MSYRPKPDISAVPTIPDHVYYDVLISNYNSATGAPIPIYFNENRTNPIIPVTGEYEMSIVRFSVDTNDLPILIPTITPGSDTIDLTDYIITLAIKPVGSSVTYFAQSPVVWVTQDSTAPIPLPPSQTGTGFQSTFGDYYYCYSYAHFQSLVTTALVSCWTQLKAILAAVTPTPYLDLVNILPPVMSWDTTTNSAVISVPQFNALGKPCFDTRYIDASGNLITNVNGVKMYFNTPLYQLFSSFNSQFQGVGTTLSGQGQIYGYSGGTIQWNVSTSFTGCDYTITIVNDGGTNQILAPNIYPVTNPNTAGNTKNLYLQIFQEYSTIVNWSPVSSIVFVSNTLPIVSNQIASPVIYNENQIVTGNGNNSRFAQIITDIESNEQSYKPNLLYNPTAEYRMISMTGNRPLTNVDISVFWRSKLGNLVQLNLLSGGSCSIKFLFRKRIV
nr:MAG: putative minor capsid protein [Lake Baikal virophage 14]